MDDMVIVATMYDNESYQAGWEMSVLANTLARSPGWLSQYVRADNLRQADLLAMSYGYILVNHGFHGGLVSVEIIKEQDS